MDFEYAAESLAEEGKRAQTYTTISYVFSIIIFLIIFIVAAIIILKVLGSEKYANSDNKIIRFLHNLITFKSLLIEQILKVLYIILTLICIYFGFSLLVASPIIAILLIILGPLVIRLLFEGLMLTVLLVKNVIDIRKKLYNNPDSNNSSFFENKPLTFAEQKTATPSQSAQSQPISSQPKPKQTPGTNEWQCPKCGKIHQNYVGTCGCGEQKPSN